MLFKYQNGYTKVETIVFVLTLIALFLLTFNNFQEARIEANDLERKNNLSLIAEALNNYKEQHGFYPTSFNGQIKSCNQGDRCFGNEEAEPCSWDQKSPSRQFCDGGYLVYLVSVPTDPDKKASYCYWSDKENFKLYAKLEGKRDKMCLLHDKLGNCLPVECNGKQEYTYGIASNDKVKLY